MARKDYRCSECGCDILRGEKHRYSRGLWNGEWSAFRTCQACAAVLYDAWRTVRHPEDGPAFGELVWYLEERDDPRAAEIRERKKQNSNSRLHELTGQRGVG